jgi:L-rhamnose isomerase
VADKISALMQFHPRLLLHTSRPIRWDSDHVVILDDSLRAVFDEIASGRVWDRVHVALDFFDASINRIAAYVIGARATRQAILQAELMPWSRIHGTEKSARGHERLATFEVQKTMPWGAVWEELCARACVPAHMEWLRAVERRDKRIQAKRRQPL